jgi:hypothetical protein
MKFEVVMAWQGGESGSKRSLAYARILTLRPFGISNFPSLKIII